MSTYQNPDNVEIHIIDKKISQSCYIKKINLIYHKLSKSLWFMLDLHTDVSLKIFGVQGAVWVAKI